ncbi:MAG: hypothetical protein ACFFD1_02815 [Candidatus Thorarchaeota archaeon]
MSFDSFDDFFTGKSDKSKVANLEVITSQLFNFTEKMFTQLATIIDQLDAKVTGFDTQLRQLSSKIDNMSRAAPPSTGGSSISSGVPPPPSHTGPSLPPPPSGSSGLPPLPGMAPPATAAGGGGFAPSPAGGPPGSNQPAQNNPLMVRAQLQNELAEAFKKIRANLKEDE